MKTKGMWQGVLRFEEEKPKKIFVGSFNINSALHFLSGKRVLVSIEMHTEDDTQESGQLSTMGKLEYDEKKKEFMLEKYPLMEILETFMDKNIKFQIELDQSVLSSRM